MGKIEMLDDDGLVTETIEKVHVCNGMSEDCQDPARCNDCGDQADPHIRVYVWTTAMGMDYFVCGFCLSIDSYVRLAS